MPKLTSSFVEKARRIKLLLMDCDGVLTDGRLFYSAEGELIKVFNVKDGQGIVEWHRLGFESGIITGRNSEIVKVRATELGMKHVRIGSANKIKDYKSILSELNLDGQQVAFIGDDIPDLALFNSCGLSFAVCDAVKKVRDAADIVTETNGGFGAVREVIDLIIESKQIN